MNNIVKKSIIFVLLVLIAKPAYPIFGVSALSHWGSGMFSSMVSGAKNHPWLAGATVGAVALGAAWLYVQRSERLETKKRAEQFKQFLAADNSKKERMNKFNYLKGEINKLNSQFKSLSSCLTQDEQSEFQKLAQEASKKISENIWVGLGDIAQKMNDLLIPHTDTLEDCEIELQEHKQAQKELEAEIAALKEYEKEIENANNDVVKGFFNTSISPVIDTLKLDEQSTVEELRDELTLVKELRETVALMVEYDKQNKLDKIGQLLEGFCLKHSENMEDEFLIDDFKL